MQCIQKRIGCFHHERVSSTLYYADLRMMKRFLQRACTSHRGQTIFTPQHHEHGTLDRRCTLKTILIFVTSIHVEIQCAGLRSLVESERASYHPYAGAAITAILVPLAESILCQHVKCRMIVVLTGIEDGTRDWHGYDGANHSQGSCTFSVPCRKVQGN